MAEGVFRLDDGRNLAAVQGALGAFADAATVARFRARNDWSVRLGGVAFPELAAGAPLPPGGVTV